MGIPRIIIALLFPTLILSSAQGANQNALHNDRTAIERIYYEHRTGTKQPFEKAMPPDLVNQLVGKDLLKEDVLKSVYGITISDQQVAAEVNRINATTRAPEMLEEIKMALGNDPDRFGRSVARPIVVDRVLRSRFENDQAIHGKERQQADRAREAALANKGISVEKQRDAIEVISGNTSEVVWQLGPPPEQPESPQINAPAPETKVNASAGKYSIEATAQVAQVLSSPDNGSHPEKQLFYFEDLHSQLRNVLNIQLQNSGDTSAVIERPTGFQIFLLISRTEEEIKVVALTIPKRSYDEWLAAQHH